MKITLQTSTTTLSTKTQPEIVLTHCKNHNWPFFYTVKTILLDPIRLLSQKIGFKIRKTGKTIALFSAEAILTEYNIFFTRHYSVKILKTLIFDFLRIRIRKNHGGTDRIHAWTLFENYILVATSYCCTVVNEPKYFTFGTGSTFVLILATTPSIDTLDIKIKINQIAI